MSTSAGTENQSDSHRQHGSRARWLRALWRREWALVAVVLGAGLVMLVFPYLPAGDGPQHIVTAWMKLALDAGVDDGRYGRLVEAASPPTNQGFFIVYRFWLTWLPWQQAVAWTLATLTTTWALGVVLLILVVAPARWPIAFLAVPLGFSWPLYMGIFSFHLATSLALIVAAAWGSLLKRGRMSEAALVAAFGMWAIIRTHLFVVVIATPLLAAFLLAARREQRLRAVGALAFGVLPAVVIGAGIVSHDGGVDARALQWEPLALGVRLRLLYLFGDPWWRQLAVAIATLVGLFSRPSRAHERALLAVGAMFVVATLVAPADLFEWRHFAVRFGAVGIAVVVLHVPIERFSTTMQRATAAGCAVFGVVGLVWLGVSQQERHRCVEEIVAAGAVPVETDALRTVVPLDPYCGSANGADGAFPFVPHAANAGMYLAIPQGGVPATSFANNNTRSAQRFTAYLHWRGQTPRGAISQQDLMRARALAVQHRTDERVVLLDQIARTAALADEVVLTIDEADDTAPFRRRGFDEIGHVGKTYLLRFVGCTFTVDAPCPRGSSCVVESGFSPSSEPLVRRDAQPGPVTLTRAPCGPRWIRVQADGHDLCDGPGGLQPLVDGPGPHRCTTGQPPAATTPP